MRRIEVIKGRTPQEAMRKLLELLLEEDLAAAGGMDPAADAGTEEATMEQATETAPETPRGKQVRTAQEAQAFLATNPTIGAVERRVLRNYAADEPASTKALVRMLTTGTDGEQDEMWASFLSVVSVIIAVDVRVLKQVIQAAATLRTLLEQAPEELLGTPEGE